MRFSSVRFSLARSTTRGAALACALALAFGFAAPAFALVEDIVIAAARGDFGGGAQWYFFIEAEGQSLPSSGTVTPPPTGPDIPNPILFSSMSQEGPLAALPDGLNEAEAIFGLFTFSDVGFDLPTSAPNFTYIELASVIANSQFSVGAASSTFTVDEILFEAVREDLGGGPGWHLFIEIEGEGLPATATVDPPTGPQMMLTSTGGGFELEFEDGPFATFAALKSAYNTGNYLFTVGEETVTLGWDPDEPLGASGEPTLSITSPADGATIPDSTPDTSFSFDCTQLQGPRPLRRANGWHAGELWVRGARRIATGLVHESDPLRLALVTERGDRAAGGRERSRALDRAGELFDRELRSAD